MNMLEITEITEQCIDRIITKFRQMPYAFYTEKAVHCYAYYLFFHEYGLGKEIYYTKSPKETILLHTEYPTINRYCEHQPAKTGTRGHFDFVIFTPDAIAKMDDKFRDECGRPLAPLVAIEFGLDYGRDHLKWDYTKLIDPDNGVQHKYLVHLMRDKRLFCRIRGDLKVMASKLAPKGNVQMIFEPELTSG